jgi:galactitol PTS system EIIA component
VMGSLAALVDLGNIDVGSPATTAEGVIRSLAARLAGSGAVKPGYADACLQREATDPTGLPTLGAGVALPHADPDLVLRDAVAVAVPAQPIPFRQMGDPDVEVRAEAVFLLALTGADGQLRALRQVAAFVQDPDRLRGLIDAKTPQDLHDLIAADSEEPS